MESCCSADAMNENGIVEVQLDNYTISVDIETATKLQTDSAYAQQYLNLIKGQFPNENIGVQNGNNEVGSKSTEVKLWRSSKCQTQADNEATLELLNLRKQLNNKFKDKKTPKNMLWSQIATSLNSMGFFVGEGTEGRERCRQKFANLQSSYLKCIDKRKQTGEGKVPDSPYFTEIDDILGDKHLTNPVLLIDSLSTASSAPSPNPSTSCSSDADAYEHSSPAPTNITPNRFESVRKTVRPKKDTVLEKITDMYSKSQENRKREFDTMIDLMREQNEQRHTQVMAIISALNKKAKKKKRNESSSSDED